MVVASCDVFSVQFLAESSPAMAWAMQTIGCAEVGDWSKANSYLQKQLAFIKNNFQVCARL